LIKYSKILGMCNFIKQTLLDYTKHDIVDTMESETEQS